MGDKAVITCALNGVLTDPKQHNVPVTPEQMARMEREMEKVQRDLKSVESRYGEDVLQLVIASGYLSKLVANGEIKRYLGQHHPEILSEFRAIIAATSLDQVNTA